MRRATQIIEIARKLLFGNGRPVRLLSFGILLNLSLLAIVAYLVWGMYGSLSTMGNKDLNLLRLVGSTAYLHEVLTDSARMAAATGDPAWEKRYREFEPRLDQTILQAAMVAREQYEENYAAQTKLTYTRLIEMENLAFALVRDGRSGEASAILFSQEYDRQKERYANALNRMSDAICMRSTDEIRSYRVRLWQAGMAEVLSLLILLFAWVGVLVAIKRHLRRRQHAEQGLSEANQRLSVILRSIGDGVIAADISGRIMMMNPVAERLTGWEETVATGKCISEVLGIGHGMCGPASDHSVAVGPTGLPDVARIARPSTLKARDGSEHLIEYASAPIRDGDDKVQGLVLVLRDFTERQRLEHEILRAERLESIGLLAGGIAHDFNNFLTGIVGNISLAKLLIGPDHEVFQTLVHAENAAKRAGDLTHQLLTFSRGGAPIKRTIAVHQLLQDWTRFALRGSAVDCAFDIESDNLWPVDADEGQISQVVNNLVLNACQAMPNGGRVHVSASNCVLGLDDPIPLKAGRYVKISVADMGAGISAENLQKIFDPYFTTKPDGIGLGLSTSFTVVRRHDGHISAHSQVGVGTTFTIYLPASDREPQVPATKTSEPLKGTGRILVMDDEEMVRDLAKRLLETLGYSVILSRDGEEAVHLYIEATRQGNPFDAVVMDLTVPGGTGGREAISNLRAFDPAVRAIVSSGYSHDPIMGEYRHHGFDAVLAKPYSAKELGEVLHALLRDETPPHHSDRALRDLFIASTDN
jgi:PAS domain S-box-containing protein